ncbi:MAG TPA: hypothetical protein DCZ62_09305 [Ruminococcus sp.]|nr:hypothetical protein [Ruminococcus sp.]
MKKLLSAFVSVLMLMSLSCAGETSADDQAEEDLVSAATADTRFSAEDGALLQSYLLGRPVETDLSGKNYDLNGNGRWDVFDLCLLKEQIEAQPAEEPQSDTIVVYFSRTGNTEKIANYLLEITGADSYVIQAAVPYSDEDIAYNNSSCRADQEQNDKTVRPEIADPISSLDGYDTVFLGYPIWWGEEPRIIDTFLESYDLSEKTVIPFCTSGSSGISVSEKNIAALVPIGEQLAGKRFSASASKDEVQQWYDSLPLTKEETEMKLNITVNGQDLTATLADSTAAKELAQKLESGAVTVELGEYGGFEKVGALPWSLTRSDESTVTQAGDIMLYQGSQITIFYGSNSWSYTPLGHVDGLSQEELSEILGQGDVSAELSIKK